MARVFVSFDYDKNRHYKYLLGAWDKNKNMGFSFNDWSSDEIGSSSISVVRGALTRRINQCTHTLVIVGNDANKLHADWREIGYRNWQNFEIAQSIKSGNRIVAVKIESRFESPEELYGCGASFANSFTQDAIIAALYRRL